MEINKTEKLLYLYFNIYMQFMILNKFMYIIYLFFMI